MLCVLHGPGNVFAGTVWHKYAVRKDCFTGIDSAGRCVGSRSEAGQATEGFVLFETASTNILNSSNRLVALPHGLE